MCINLESVMLTDKKANPEDYIAYLQEMFKIGKSIGKESILLWKGEQREM